MSASDRPVSLSVAVSTPSVTGVAFTSLSGLAALIDAALPQTQCTRCGYPDCAAYASAIAVGEAAINQCPPGGAEGVERLARITGQPVSDLNPENGFEGPLTLAVIDENWCIGCTLCIKACPTDAIIGANKRMHTVIDAHCTGCELCIPVCPVDCISLSNISDTATGWQAWPQSRADHARERYTHHVARNQHTPNLPPNAKAAATASDSRANQLPANEPAAQPAPSSNAAPLDAKQAIIAAAIARARAKRGE